MLLKLMAQDRSLLFVEHNMSLVEALSDRVALLNQGEILLEAPYSELRQDARVKSLYLGEA